MAGPADLYQTGDHASRPAANSGCVLYSCTDHGLVYRSDGSAWSTWLTLPSAGSTLTVENEGSALATAATTLDFVGAGVTASGTGAEKTITIPGGSFDENLLPWTINVNPFQYATQTNWNSPTANASSLFGWIMSSSGAQNAEIGWDLVIAAGTWDLEIVFYRNPNRGIATLRFDGVDTAATVDFYGTDAGRVVGSYTGLVVATSAKRRVTLKMATKNASASSYFGAISSVQFRRIA